MATERIIWRDGEFVAWQDATVHVLAQSLQRGSLAFDYVSVHETAQGVAVFRLRDHIDRLVRTCQIVGLPLDYEADALVDACAATVRRNPGATSLKISALIPSIEVELVPQDPHVAVFVAAYDSDRDIIAKNTGEFRRRSDLALYIERDKTGRREDLVPPHAKVAANYTAAMMAKWQARRRGFDDIVLLDERGFVTEAPTTNLFLVDDRGNLATPPAHKVLLGITRDTVLTLAKSIGMNCEERDIGADELCEAREVFLTGTSVGVWPVLSINREAIGDGRVGAITAQLRDTYRAVVRGEVDDFDHWRHYV